MSHTERIPERRLAHSSAESDGGAADSPKQNPKSLNDLLTDEPLSYRQAVPILAETLLSLDEIHTSNRQHVPLQPYAIQLTASGRVVIPSQPADSAPATMVFGGAKYSAPEAFREGAGAVPHAASDSYVVAFIFYELLAGARVFGREFSAVDQRSPAAWLNWHTNESKRPKVLARLLPGFPSYLSDLLDEMLEKDPQRRQFNFRAIAEKLLNVSEPTVLITKPLGSNPLPKPGIERLTRLRSKFGSQLSTAVSAAESVRPLEFMRRAATFLDNWKVITAFALPFVFLLLSVNVISSHYKNSDISTLKEKLIPPFIETDTGGMVLVYRRDAPSFYIDRTEVSNKDYRRFCEATGRTFPADPEWDSEYSAQADAPIINISRTDARAFADWSGKWLPSVFEWKAASEAIPRPLVYPLAGTLPFTVQGFEWVDIDIRHFAQNAAGVRLVQIDSDHLGSGVTSDLPPGGVVTFRCAAGIQILETAHRLRAALQQNVQHGNK